MKTIFFISLFIVFYTFIGYGMLLFTLIKLKRFFKGKLALKEVNDALSPTCTIIVAAYNEENIISSKIANTLALNYPANRLKYIFVTDGSTDKTADIISNYPEIVHLHQPQRNGKIAAVHRAINQVETKVIVFTDANTFLNKNALVEMCKHYTDTSVGAIAGEKRIQIDENADATASEGFYWKYESKLKAWDSELYSVVGAAGELFSIRKDLYQPVPTDSILDDFMISMRIAEKGHRVVYEPAAYAVEDSSATIKEELKRKVRISAGGIQSIIYLKGLLNIFNYPILSFQYVSHRVLRWTITPFLLIISFILNIIIVINYGGAVYTLICLLQGSFYLMAILGWIAEKKEVRIKALFIPYYFCMMNYAVIAGILRYFNKGQNVLWDKAERKQSNIKISNTTPA